MLTITPPNPNFVSQQASHTVLHFYILLYEYTSHGVTDPQTYCKDIPMSAFKKKTYFSLARPQKWK